MFDKEKKGKRAGKKTRLSLHQKILIVIAVLLAIALVLVIVGRCKNGWDANGNPGTEDQCQSICPAHSAE